MKPIAILQHEATQGPGVLREHLDYLGIPYQLFCPPLEGSAPRQAHDYCAVVSLGSNHGANEHLPWIAAELALLRDAQQRDVPALGHCFGAQMLARAMDARVWRNACAHIGWSKVWVTQPAQQLMHLPGQTTLFHWHYDTFDIPRGAMRTMYGKHCLNKGFRRGRQWAFQGHLEVTAESVQAWCAAGHDELACACGPAVQTEAQILAELPARALQLRATAHRVYGAWTDQIARPVMVASGGWGA